MVVTEAARRLGISLTVVIYPAQRATVLAQTGAVDGEVARSYEYQDRVENLVRVEESLREFRMTGYALTPLADLHGWSSLTDLEVSISYRRGLRELQAQLDKWVGKGRTHPVNETVQGLRKLVAGRSGVHIDLASSVQPLLRMPEFKASGIRALGDIRQSTVHTYVHSSRAELAPKLQAAIAQMKAEGLLAEFEAADQPP